MKRAEKMITLNDADIQYINQTYLYIEQMLIELNKIVSRYHCQFETGYGWRQNLAKLNDLAVISNDLYKLIYNWYDSDYKIGQVVPLTEWEKYCRNAVLIQQVIENLIKKHA